MKYTDEESQNAKTLKIVRGISQAVSQKYDSKGAPWGLDQETGKPIEIGLQREKEIPFTEKGIMDGFGITINGNILKLSYHSEIALKDVYQKKKFEEDIIDTMEQCISFIKKEYKKVAKETLSLKMKGEPVLRVEHMNKTRSWVTGYCLYEIEGIENDKVDQTRKERLEKNIKFWDNFKKKDSKAD